MMNKENFVSGLGDERNVQIQRWEVGRLRAGEVAQLKTLQHFNGVKQ